VAARERAARAAASKWAASPAWAVAAREREARDAASKWAAPPAWAARATRILIGL